ncbi:GDP-L-fucose synthase [Prochlorococcus sp. AH-716-P05]|nr:GDP-L-fucose synthase [Prochlorococcus sp. AH-716-P05]
MLIRKDDTFFVAGHKGMVGSALCRKLADYGYKNIKTISRTEVDLTNTEKVDEWFSCNKPDVVILAAAKVGGIQSNRDKPTEYLLDNIKIQNNVIESSWKHNTRRFLFLGSSCIYPKFANQPINEEELLSGPLEPTNDGYALAKIVGIKLIKSLRIQYGFDGISLMPSNIYGPGDNYHPINSHVLASFVRKFYKAFREKEEKVICWGSGSPYREFLHVDDLAEASIFALENWNPDCKNSPKLDDGNLLTYLNVGTGLDLTIKELAQKIAMAYGYDGKIIWDTSKPDGTPRKKLNISRIESLGWSPKISLDDGIAEVINLFSKKHGQEM